MGLYLQSPEVLLLEELLDEVPDKQKDDGARFVFTIPCEPAKNS